MVEIIRIIEFPVMLLGLMLATQDGIKPETCVGSWHPEMRGTFVCEQVIEVRVNPRGRRSRERW